MTDEANRPIPNSYWVIPGRLAGGEYPGSANSAEASAKLKALLSAGINHFIDLTEQGELMPYVEIAEGKARQLGIRVGFERHPIVDMGVPRDPHQMAKVLDAIDGAMRDGNTVYVHCWGGVGRTGTVIGCWLVRHGRTGEEALEQVNSWWQGVEKVERHPNSPQTSEQCAYVRNWSEPS